MAHITGPLVVFDGLATPIARNFDPRKLDQASSAFAYKRTASDTREKWVTADIVWSDSNSKRPTVRQATTITYPIVRLVAGVETVVGIARSDVSFVIPDMMTEAEAEDLHAFSRNLPRVDAIRFGVTRREPIFA